MPSKSPAQARFMAACAHGAGYASCPPTSVAKEFNQADKGGPMLRKKRSAKKLDEALRSAAKKHGMT